ncbi:tryptophan 2,3-dioxygenase family protein [Corallococcus sp. NCRR]|uniref:tryptophan 2,3-dioxygenase family protein n=1 Tax=Corallococcus sp. NCRR TaxID=2996782 RepID=UPI0022A8EF45|nr:tryptophan 2,3-dioxygenase family protein [Corallococcus sp. NCRR]WAS87610.1 tryptophan 2,3-dioxygenase family protein [Corallococcus sp. NCRR]
MHTSTDYSHAEKLKQELTQPLFNVMLKKWVGKGELDYERYLHTGTLLALQSPEDELVSHDELMFQIVHQSQELYLKLASREMVEVVAEMDRDALWAVSARLVRVQKILAGISAEMAILETMTPAEYQVIRRSLGNGSGQESPGYNTLRHAADGLESAMERMLARRGLTLFQVYSAGGPKDLQHVCEQLVTVDESFQGWLYAHYQLVRRTIGIDRTVKALDGLPSQVLQARMTLPLFRALWDVRVELTAGWKREGGYTPGESRTGGGCPMAAINAMKDTAVHAPVAQAQAAHAHVAAQVHHAAVAHAAPAHAHEARTGGGCPMHAMNAQHAPVAHAAAAHAHSAPVAHAAAAHAHSAPVHASATHAHSTPVVHAAAAHAHSAPVHAAAAHAHSAPVAHAVPAHAPHASVAHAPVAHAPAVHAQPAPASHAPHAAPHAPHAVHAPVAHAPHAPAPHAAAAPAPVAHGPHAAPHAPTPHGPHPHSSHAAHVSAYVHAQELRSQS